MDEWRSEEKLRDFRFYQLIQAQYTVASAFGGTKIQLKPGDVFPSLRDLDKEEKLDWDDVDPEASAKAIRSLLSHMTIR